MLESCEFAKLAICLGRSGSGGGGKGLSMVELGLQGKSLGKWQEMDKDTVVRKSSVRPDGFARYPFQLVEFDSLEPINNKYLIDAVGYISLQLTLCYSLPFSKQGAVRKSYATASQLADRLYLSSTSSTMIVDDEQIPFFKQFKSDDSGIKLAKELLQSHSTCVKAGTLKNLLMWARNRKYDAATFHCAVRIDKIRTKRGWNYPSCGGEKCRKGNLDRKQGRFWCDSCHSSVDYPVLRYRLELEVSDDTAQTVVVMFDETARTVVKCSAGSIVGSEEQGEEETGLPPALANIVGTLHTLELKSNSYYEHANYESFTCWSVVLEEALLPLHQSRVNTRNHAGVIVLCVCAEWREARRGGVGGCSIIKSARSDGEESFVADSKTKGSDVGCSSKAEKRRRLVLDSSE
ncbi:reverse transcriptase domain-containing protein [Tanacetum coccineum]